MRYRVVIRAVLQQHDIGGVFCGRPAVGIRLGDRADDGEAVLLVCDFGDGLFFCLDIYDFRPVLGNVDNLDGKTAEKFRKGQYKIEAKLDLHGLKEKQAFEAVKDFILKAYLHKKRCVLIITGKGIKKDDEPWYEAKGVIREALPAWLNNAEIRPFILSMTPAKVEDGGSGAMYVLLKRQRNL